ncbi:transposase [Streptomyces sp. NPDC060275]|uniref:transposase n=1 Tax=Streptomyces sp. NPDC060275 TaxID=3347090 RepID=UPI0036547EF4
METFTGLRSDQFGRLRKTVRDRKVGASSPNYRFSANMQVIVDAESRLVVAAARPAPGNTADAKAWRDSGLAAHREGATVLGDGAYINTGLIVPHRKRAPDARC